MSVARTSSRGRRVGPVSVVLAVTLTVGLAACAGTSGQQVEVRPRTGRRSTPHPSTTAAPDCAQMLPADALAAQLTMVMVTSPDAAADPIRAGKVGGFGLKGNQPKDVGERVAAAVADAPIPPFVGADEEGGTVQRLRLALGDLPAAATAAKSTPAAAAAAAGQHAAGMKRLGFNMNFAPVADVGSGSGLGTRSYGTDPATVTGFVDPVLRAIRKAGVIPVVKHWPGIGGGKDDPHQKLTTLAGIESLRTRDLIPFQKAIADGAPAIMVTHAEVPGLTARGEPTSLSRAAITDELRGREGFEGLVLTDSLGMGAVLALGTQAEAAEKAIAAGADVAMISGTDVVDDVHARLVDAIDSKRIPAEQVLASVRRVLAAKGVDGPCLDAVARYSALARPEATSTTTASSRSAATTSDAGTATTATGKAGQGTSSTSTTLERRSTATTVDSGING